MAGSGEANVGTDPRSAGGTVNRRRVVVALIAVLVLARCGGDVVALGRTGAANGDETFRNGPFLIRLDGLEHGVRQIDVDAAAKARGVTAYKPKNGQFIVFHAKATNVGLASASMPSTSTTLSDAAGNQYAAAGPYAGAVGQGFDVSQFPGTTRSGWFVFDVPDSVTLLTTLNVQSDPHPGTTNPPTLVKYG